MFYLEDEKTLVLTNENKKDILNSWNATLENYFFSKNEKDKNEFVGK